MLDKSIEFHSIIMRNEYNAAVKVMKEKMRADVYKKFLESAE